MIENKRFYLDKNGINDREYEFGVLGEDELVDIINELNDENEQLKKALFFYLAIAISESSIDYQNDLNKWCNLLFNCNYEEAKRKYGDFEYGERWEPE